MPPAGVASVRRNAATSSVGIIAISQSPIFFWLVVNIFLLVVGTAMDGAMILVLLTPLFVPIIHSYGIDPVHFGVVFVLNLEIGAVSPPVGVVMATTMSIANVSMEEFTREGLPLFAALIAVLFLITFVPQLVLFLPNLMYG